MVRHKGRKKHNTTALEQIGPALIPAVALTAVPRSPPPRVPPGIPLRLATAVFGAAFPAQAMGEPSHCGDEAAFSDPESSLYDYQQMEEPGYSSVGFGTWPNQNRKSYSDREKAPTPPLLRNAGTVGVLSQSGDVYHILEADEAVSSDQDLYALPAKGKVPGKKGSLLNLEESTSLDRTRREVCRAMEAVQDMPVEETMMQLSQSKQASSSGRGTMRGDDFGEANDEGERPPEPPTQMDTSANAAGSDMSRHHQAQLREEAFVMLKQDMQSLPLSVGGSGSSRLASHRSNTPRDAVAFTLQVEVQRMKEENHQLHEEVLTLRKVAAAMRIGDREGAELLLQSQHMNDLKEENGVLKDSVFRLNQELSRYQAKFRPLSNDEQSRLQGLSAEGPIPTWLVSKQYLAPLFLAYDDLMRKKEEALQQCQQELQALKNQTEEIVQENHQYRLKGDSSIGNVDRINKSDWQQLQEQARLVLEENQILLEQLEVQQCKVKELSSAHMQEVGRITKQVTVIETEKEEAEQELEEMRHKYKDVKYKYDKVLLNAGSHVSVQDHINSVADLKRSVTEEKEELEKEKEKMANRLKASDEERKQQVLTTIELSAENKRLRVEIKALQKAVRKSQNKMLVLQKAIQQSANKEQITQNELENVIKIVEKIALERDTAFKVVKEQQRDCKDTVNRMVGNSVVMGKLEERLKMYKLKTSAKLQTVAEKLKEQDDSFNRQRQEYEREIRYLRLLLKEKETLISEMAGEKKCVEEDLEIIWQAATSENQRFKDTLRNSVHKLREHPSLRAALDDEDDLENLVHFSE